MAGSRKVNASAKAGGQVFLVYKRAHVSPIAAPACIVPPGPAQPLTERGQGQPFRLGRAKKALSFDTSRGLLGGRVATLSFDGDRFLALGCPLRIGAKVVLVGADWWLHARRPVPQMRRI